MSDPTSTLTVVPEPESAPAQFAVSQEDLELVLEPMHRIIEAQTALGAEYERHLRAATQIQEQLSAARQAEVTFVDMLARKYVKGPGKFDFRPDVGAFVRIA